MIYATVPKPQSKKAQDLENNNVYGHQGESLQNLVALPNTRAKSGMDEQ